jgi:transposase-like protein
MQYEMKQIFLDTGSALLRVQMELQYVYTRFPTEETCITFLEQIRWSGRVLCPHCNGSNVTPMLSEQRHHCNRCKASFSVTAQTIFHKSRVDLRKWVLAVIIYLDYRRGQKQVSAQHLARVLEVNKNTAWYMRERIRREYETQLVFLQSISKGVRA